MLKLEKVEINYSQEFCCLFSNLGYIKGWAMGCRKGLIPVFLRATRKEIFCCLLKHLSPQ